MLLSLKGRIYKISLLFVLIILLSGCVLGPQNKLLKSSVRDTEDPELLNIFSFIEILDFVSYFGLQTESITLFKDFGRPRGVVVRNISQFFVNAENHYNEKNLELYKGELNYYIIGENTTTQNYTHIYDITLSWYRNASRIGYTPDLGQFVFYLSNISNEYIIETEILSNWTNITEFFRHLQFPDWYWLIWTGFEYHWHDRFGGCRSYVFSYVILIDPAIKIFALFPSSGFPVC
ncbi:MAG: hypothetical protein ACFE95_20685 [Candidatus Hodarchaeota archaeon]